MEIHLCLLARDESPSLSRAIGSARPLADQVVVGDTGSTDGTADVARQCGARVWEIPFIDFAQARNALLDRAAPPGWVLVLDGDEEIIEANPGAIREQLALRPEAFLVKIQSPFPWGEEEHWAPRLFRRGRYIHPAQEILQVEKPIPLYGMTILHHGYRTEEGLCLRLRRHLALLEALDAGNPHRLYHSIRAHHYLEEHHLVIPLVLRLLASEGELLPPKYAGSYYLGAVAYLNTGKPEQAEEMLWKGLGAYPDSPDLNFFLALLAGLRHINLSGQAEDTQHPMAHQPTTTRCLSGQVQGLLAEMGLEIR